MATFSAVFAPGSTNATAKVTALAAAASSAEVVFNKNAKIVIVAAPQAAATTTPGIKVKFGQSGMAAADATGFFIPTGVYVSFDLSNAWDRVRFFNGSSASVDIYVMQLSD
jgi:hypothetical protein